MTKDEVRDAAYNAVRCVRVFRCESDVRIVESAADAYWRGLGPDVNPHKRGTEQAELWYRSWHAAKRKFEEGKDNDC